VGDIELEPRQPGSRRLAAPAVDIRPERQRTASRGSNRARRLLAAAALVVLGAIMAAGAFIYIGGNSGLRFQLRSALATNGANPESAAVVVPKNNLVALQAQKWGVSQCLGGITQLSEFLTRNTDYTWLARRGDKDADSQMFSAIVAAREKTSGAQALSGLFATPARGGACNLAYQMTMFHPDTCARTRETVFPTFSTRIEFGAVAEAYSTADGRATLYLLPAGPAGCVAIKSEVFY
jgi:hypothetical protein